MESLAHKVQPWVAGQAPESWNAAAVGVVLVPNGESADILLVKRARRRGDPWSGHIAFPGGRIHRSDGNLKQTLVRELREEVGLNVGMGRVLGALETLSPSNRPALKVTPFLILFDGRPELSMSDEIEGAFWVDIYDLAHGLSERGDWGRSVRAGPVYHVKDLVVWGMTARLIRRMLEGIA